MKKASKKSMDALRKLGDFAPAFGYVAAICLVLNAVKDIFDVRIIKRFKLWSGYQIWIVRKK